MEDLDVVGTFGLDWLVFTAYFSLELSSVSGSPEETYLLAISSSELHADLVLSPGNNLRTGTNYFGNNVLVRIVVLLIKLCHCLVSPFLEIEDIENLQNTLPGCFGSLRLVRSIRLQVCDLSCCLRKPWCSKWSKLTGVKMRITFDDSEWEALPKTVRLLCVARINKEEKDKREERTQELKLFWLYARLTLWWAHAAK